MATLEEQRLWASIALMDAAGLLDNFENFVATPASTPTLIARGNPRRFWLQITNSTAGTAYISTKSSVQVGTGIPIGGGGTYSFIFSQVGIMVTRPWFCFNVTANSGMVVHEGVLI